MNVEYLKTDIEKGKIYLVVIQVKQWEIGLTHLPKDAEKHSVKAFFPSTAKNANGLLL